LPDGLKIPIIGIYATYFKAGTQIYVAKFFIVFLTFRMKKKCKTKGEWKKIWQIVLFMGENQESPMMPQPADNSQAICAFFYAHL
jgi:hypothetical protein